MSTCSMAQAYLKVGDVQEHLALDAFDAPEKKGTLVRLERYTDELAKQ